MNVYVNDAYIPYLNDETRTQIFYGGSSSGMSNSGRIYGTEYRTLMQSGNIKFIQRKGNSAVAPMETMTKGRVYVTVNADNKLKSISYYDLNNKRNKTIDLDKIHMGMKPHTHHGYEHNEKDDKKGAAKLTPKEKKMVARAERLWYNYNRK